MYGEHQANPDPEGKHEDVFRGGDGNDEIDALDGQRDELYCGEGQHHYVADEAGARYFPGEVNDYVDKSCEKKGFPGIPWKWYGPLFAPFSPNFLEPLQADVL